LSYVGDSRVGRDVNIGAGTITCNYDGANKWPTVIDDGAFIGSGSMLVAPVRIGAGATIGAGSTIAANAPLSVAAAKRTVYLGMHAPFAEADDLWEPVYLSADAQEGPRAFAEKRPPRWQGR